MQDRYCLRAGPFAFGSCPEAGGGLCALGADGCVPSIKWNDCRSNLTSLSLLPPPPPPNNFLARTAHRSPNGPTGAEHKNQSARSSNARPMPRSCQLTASIYTDPLQQSPDLEQLAVPNTTESLVPSAPTYRAELPPASAKMTSRHRKANLAALDAITARTERYDRATNKIRTRAYYHPDAIIARTERHDPITDTMTQARQHLIRCDLNYLLLYHLLTDIAVPQILALLALRNDAYSASTSEFLTESSWTDLPPAPAKKTPTADL